MNKLSFRDALQTAQPAEVQTRNPDLFSHLWIPRHSNWSG
jgi:hypothetical protein